jgi:hypothetical protein
MRARRQDCRHLPGQAAIARRRAALADGVALHAEIMEGLAPHAERPRRARPTVVGAA